MTPHEVETREERAEEHLSTADLAQSVSRPMGASRPQKIDP